MPISALSPTSTPRGARLALAASLLPLALLVASCTTSPQSANNTAPPANTAPQTTTPGDTGETASAATATSLFESPRKAEGALSIQIITNGISPFWDPMAIGMKKAAEELGCEAAWAGPAKSDVPGQKRLIEDALAKGVDGIALSCINGEASKPLIEQVLAKNVPIITFDSDSTGSRRLAYIGTNNYNAGKKAGEATVKLLPNGGKLVGFVGESSAENAAERRKGFEDALKGHNIELLEVIDDQKDPAKARRNVEDALAKHGEDIQGFLGLFSYNGPAIVEALTASGKRAKYKVICFDAEPLTLQALEKGNVDIAIAQKPYDFGYLSTRLLYLINRKGWSEAKKEMDIPDDGLKDTGVEVLTPANVGDFKKKLEKLGVKSS
jgi:ribose transport system substrate-binding protein